MWVYTLLPKIWNMSLTASMVILVVLVARLLLKRAPRRFAYILWAVVLFRLLCPFSFPAPFSLLQVAEVPVTNSGTIEYVPPEIVHMEYPKVDLPGALINMYVQDALPYGEEQLAADPLEAPMAAMTAVWIAGMAGMAGYSIYSLLKLRQRLVGAVRYVDNIWLSDSVASPFVIGLIRPKIYLPSTLSEKERGYILLHEQTHIRRWDHIFKVLAFLALTIHWFNPLVWLAFVLSGEDMEMSCDEAVMESMDQDLRADYSASLLSLATGRKIIAGTPLAFGEGDTGKRIKNVLNYRKHGFWVIAAAVAVLAVLLAVLAANPMMDDNSELFGAVYQIEDELYSDARYDSVYNGENYPEYCITADSGLMRKETYYDDPWHDMGGLYQVEMSRQEIYSLFDTLPNRVHERIDEVKNVYRADTNDESGITHWVMTTRDGDVLIAMGYLSSSEKEDHIRYLFEVFPVSGKHDLDYFVLTIERALELKNVEVFYLYESDSLDHSVITGWYTDSEIGYSIFRYEREKDRNHYQILPGSVIYPRESDTMIYLSTVQLTDKTFDIVLSVQPDLAKIERTTDIDIASAVRHTPHMEILFREPGWEDPYAPVYWRFSNKNDETLLEGFGEELMVKGPDVSLLDAVAKMAGTTAVEIISKTQMNTAPYYTFASWQTVDNVGFCALRDRTTPDGLAAYERLWGTSIQKDSLHESKGLHWERRGGIYDGVALNFDILISVNNDLFRIEQTKNGKTELFDVTTCPAVMIFPHAEKHTGQMRYVLYGRNNEVISEFLYGDAEFDVTEEAVRPYMIVTTGVSVYASWYPDGFDFDYDKVSQLTVGTEYHGIAFSLSEPEVTELEVGVDFYHGNTIKQLSHTLTVNEEGSFTIPMPENADPGDKLICFIPYGETGKFVFKVDIT